MWKASGSNLGMSVTIRSINSPWDTPAVFGPYTDFDSMGWVPTPTTQYHDSHSIELDFSAEGVVPTANIPVEIEGLIEVQVEEGPLYSA
jgi:hypothetical protein